MILLFNVKITQYGLSHYQRSSWLPKYDRVDIFKYCLASYAAMLPLFSKCILYIQLEKEFQHRHEELEKFIKDLFPADKLELHWHRNNHTRDWRALCEQYFPNDEELIWFAGNDDHIFIDYDLDMVSAGVKLLQEDPDPYSAIYYSHWPEQMRLSVHHGGELTEDGNFIKFRWRTFDAIRIFKAARFKRYWHDTDFGDQLVFRTDHLYHAGYELTSNVYAPIRELVRHYDGYSHVGQQLVNLAPPLVIPPGFFQKDIKIRIGYPDRLDGFVNLNAAAQNLYAAHPAGADYRWVEEDIPLFWRDRVSYIDTAPGYDHNAMNQSRDYYYLTSTRIPMHCYQIHFTDRNAAPESWFQSQFRHGKN